MTSHNSAQKGEIAKTVFLAGDPNRVKFIAEKYIKDAKLVSQVRGALYYTGTFNGKPVTIGTAGMGCGSMNIYSYELFTVYDVDTIVRIGSSGAYLEDMTCGEVVLATEAIADQSWFADYVLGESLDVLRPTEDLNNKIRESAKRKGKKIREGRVHSADLFYDKRDLAGRIRDTNAICCEMEAYTLFANAIRTNKQAACILTLVDSLVTDAWNMTPEERSKSVEDMVEIALGII